MEVFRASPYNLVQGDFIVAKVQALNVIDWSAESDASAGTPAEV